MELINRRKELIIKFFKLLSIFIVPHSIYYFGIFIDQRIMQLSPNWPNCLTGGILVVLMGILFYGCLKDEIANFFAIRKLPVSLFLLSPVIISRTRVLMSVEDRKLAFTTVITILAASLAEEIIFRGILMSYGLKDASNMLDAMFVLIYSGFIFGFIHLVNALHRPLGATIVQMASAACVGVIFGAVFLYSRSIYASWIVHFYNNYVCQVYNPNDVVVLHQSDIPRAAIGLILFVLLLILIYVLSVLKQPLDEEKEESILEQFFRSLNCIN